ncbi:MAG: Dabb family protein [Planctomycetota bacterium]|nr:Dabb family protein [Planctomycetota bacterium]
MAQFKQITLVRLPPSTDRDAVADIFETYEDLPNQVAGVVDVSYGPYFSPEGLHKGFTHAVVLTFEDEPARDAYLENRASAAVREKVLAQLAGGLADLITFDFKVCNRFLY